MPWPGYENISVPRALSDRWSGLAQRLGRSARGRMKLLGFVLDVVAQFSIVFKSPRKR